MIIPALNIKPKEDTAEKTAKIQGKPSRHYIFDWEFNAIVNLLNYHDSILKINSENIDFLLEDAVKVELGVIEEPFIDVLNSSVGINYSSPVCVLFTQEGINYVYVFIGVTGNYGIAQLQFTDNDFYLAYRSSQPSLDTKKELFIVLEVQRSSTLSLLDYVSHEVKKNTIGETDFVFSVKADPVGSTNHLFMEFVNQDLDFGNFFYTNSITVGTLRKLKLVQIAGVWGFLFDTQLLTAGDYSKIYLKIEQL